MALIRAACATMGDALQCQRGQLLCWAPIFLSIGIGGYFAQAHEPGDMMLLAIVGAGVVSVGLAYSLRLSFGPALAALACIALGFVLASARAHSVGGPVLEFRYYGPIEGRVVAMDRSASDRIRLTLDHVYLEGVAAHRIPHKVRVSLHGQEGVPIPGPGSHAMLTGFLSPPPSPAEPHGFDFERHAWFQGLGAVGYSRSPAVRFAPPREGAALWIFRTRMALSETLQNAIPGQAGAVAAAVTVGDRSGMGQDVLTDLRRSNLAHLLAISGLHMGLLTGFIFALTRFCLALIPRVALTWPTRKIAAITALVAGAAYLALSGGAVATERAYVMAAVVFGAVILGRRALTLRAVAVAALVVLLLRPEALLGAGFQMSFAATTALVLAFRWLSARDMLGLPRWIRPTFAVVVSSAVAGFATAPIAAAHFNIFSHYGLLANLLSVPVMGAVVMPAAVIAVVLSIFGLAGPALWVMARGIDWILGVADWVAGLDGAVGRISAPGPEVLPLLALGALILALWKGRARYSGAVLASGAAVLWMIDERPSLLISPSGGLVGLVQEEWRVLSKERGDGFVASIWLENDGDSADQAAAYARRTGDPLRLGDQAFVHLTGKRAREATCAGSAILVLNDTPEATLPCATITPASLRETGSIAFFFDGDKLTRLTARDVTGARLWNTPSLREAAFQRRPVRPDASPAPEGTERILAQRADQ
ncbi:MAG: ComEC/Rec2 family competence protein [Pseudomonadota bacterium]